jgi:hypothetical protein
MDNSLQRIRRVLGSESYISLCVVPSSYTSSRVEYRALEGFVLAVSPFNFTAIGGNLPGSQSLLLLQNTLTSNHPQLQP